MRLHLIISFPFRYCTAFIRSRNQQAIVELAMRQQLATYSQMSSKPRLTHHWVALSGCCCFGSGRAGEITSSFNRPISGWMVGLVQELRRRRSVWIGSGSSGSIGFVSALSWFRPVAARFIFVGWTTEDFGVASAQDCDGSERSINGIAEIASARRHAKTLGAVRSMRRTPIIVPTSGMPRMPG